MLDSDTWGIQHLPSTRRQLLWWMSAEHLGTWPSAARRRGRRRHGLHRRLPPGLIPCRVSACHPCHRPREALCSPSSQNISKQPGRLPVITGCPNINVTLTQWPRSLPSPLVNLMDLLTAVPPRTATDFAAGQPLESKGQPAALRTVGKKGEMCISGSRSCPG